MSKKSPRTLPRRQPKSLVEVYEAEDLPMDEGILEDVHTLAEELAGVLDEDPDEVEAALQDAIDYDESDLSDAPGDAFDDDDEDQSAELFDGEDED